MSKREQGLLVGWAGRDVTPKGKVSLWGQHHVRITEDVRDPLTVSALALASQDGRETAILVSLDAVAVTDYVSAGCRRRLAKERADIPSQALIISATHTHTGPDQLPTGGLRPDLPDDVWTAKDYADLLIEQISEAVIEAWDNRTPGALSWGRGYAAVGFNRRATYLDGSTRMYGSTAVPNFSHLEGREEHAVELLFTYDLDHALTGMIMNVACPSQCTEGSTFISADFWHETRQEIRRRHGAQVNILAQCAAAGDQSPRTLVCREADARILRLKGYGDDYNRARRQDIADKLAAVVDEILPLLSTEIHDQLDFRRQTHTLALPYRRATEKELNDAREAVAALTKQLAEMENNDPTTSECSQALMVRAFNEHVVSICEAQQRGEQLTLPVELHILRIGDVAICSNRFEYFLDYGDRIKGRSKALQTFIVQLAGQGNYLLTEGAWQGGSYGATVVSSPIGPEGGQKVVETTVAAINELFE